MWGDKMSGDSGNSYDEYETAYGSPTKYLDVSNIPRHEVLNFEGTPTQFYDDTGLRGILTREGIKDVSSFNPIVKPGEKITADTPIQQVDEEGVLLFSDGEGVTRRNTGVPAIAGTVGDQAYMREIKNRGVFGTIGGDFLSAAKDPAFHKFLAAAAAITGGGLALNSAFGVGGLGATATASPVSLGGLSAGSALGAPVGTGSLTAGITPASVAAFEAGLPTAIGSAAAPAAVGGLGGLTGQQAFQLARMALPAVGSILGGGGAGGAGGGAGGGSGRAGSGGTTINQYGSSGSPTAFYTGAPDTNVPTGLINYQPLAFATPKESQLIDVEESDLFRQPTLAAKGGEMRKSMQEHSELNDVEPQLLNMIMSRMAFRDGDKVHVPEFITGATGHYVKGKGDGQSDDIPAMLADGEFVWDADTVAQLGNGSSDAGAKFLDEFRKAIRSHKRSAPNDKIPPKASPLQYVKEAMKNTKKA